MTFFDNMKFIKIKIKNNDALFNIINEQKEYKHNRGRYTPFIDLSYYDLSFGDFSHIILDSYEIANANFSFSNLYGASFNDTIFNNCDISYCDISNSNIKFEQLITLSFCNGIKIESKQYRVFNKNNNSKEFLKKIGAKIGK